MPTKSDTGVGNIKEFQPWFFVLGGIFSLGVIWGSLNYKIEKYANFQEESKEIHKDLNQKSIHRHEKSLGHTNDRFNELREVIRLHRNKTDSTHEKVIELSVNQGMLQKNVSDTKQEVKDNKVILEKMLQISNEILKQNRKNEQ